MEKLIYVFDDVYQEPAARSQAEGEKTNAFGWLAKARLWDRPKEADIALSSCEKRYEPFWNIKAARHSVFEKRATYAVVSANPHAVGASLLGQRFDLPANKTLSFAAVEHCEKHTALSEYFDGIKREASERSLADYATRFGMHELGAEESLNLVTPEVSAAFLLQQVKARLMEPIQADEMLDDRLEISALTLYYRPVYAFEFSWRDKKGVVEIDALTGQVNREGSMFGGMARKLASRDALFDVGAEIANAIVPGGGVVVKLVGVATRQ